MHDKRRRKYTKNNVHEIVCLLNKRETSSSNPKIIHSYRVYDEVSNNNNIANI
jgi:hypothetical protein